VICSAALTLADGTRNPGVRCQKKDYRSCRRRKNSVFSSPLLKTGLKWSAPSTNCNGPALASIRWGLSKEDARFCEREFKNGRTVVVVHTDGQSDEARAVLERNGAYDVRTRCRD
jgi:hypothetical protein